MKTRHLWPRAGLTLLLLLGGCQLLQLPFTALKYGAQGLGWAVRNAAGLAPLATLFVMADPEVVEPPVASPHPLEELLRRPPTGAVAVALFPASWLADPGRVEALRTDLLARNPGGRGTRLLLARAETDLRQGLRSAALPVYTPAGP